MRILVSNDDGVTAPGLMMLANELTAIAQVEVVAPDRNHSGASNSLTLHAPLRTRQLDNGYHCVEGTPTDCVHLALSGLLIDPVDIVISGINQGANLGDDILYSGTVAAAMEGRTLGLPALAVSLIGRENPQHYQTAAVIIRDLVLKLRKSFISAQTILNINVPDLPLDQIKGMQVTRLGVRHKAEPVIKAEDPRGRAMYWIGLPGAEADSSLGTDFHAVNQGYVSITPLHMDMTHHKISADLTTWLHS